MHRSVDPESAARAYPKELPFQVPSARVLRLCARLLVGFMAAGTLVVAAAPAAHAEPVPSKSIAVLVEGPDADAVRADILAITPKTLGVVDPAAFARALRNVGLRQIGSVISQKRVRDKVLERIRKAALEVHAEAVVVGYVRTSAKGGQEVYLIYVDQIPGDLAVDDAAPLSESSAERRKAIDGLLSAMLTEIAPAGGAEAPAPAAEPKRKRAEPAEAAPEPKAEPPEAETKPEEAAPAPAPAPAPVKERRPHDPGTALASIELGFELGWRWFSYSDPVTPNLRPYNVGGAPMAAISSEVYPLAGTSIPVLKDLGITVGYARAFGLSSKLERGGGAPFDTTYQRFSAGLRERVAFGPSGPVIGISAGVRLVGFNFDATGQLAKEVPDVSYTVLRGGVDGYLPAGPARLALGAEYLQPLSSGKLYDRFSQASVHGVGLSGGVVVPVGSGFDLRLIAEYARFFSSFNPRVSDPYIAGGALDQLLGLRLAAGYVY